VLTEADYYARYLGYNDERAFREIGAERGRHWDDRAVANLIAQKAVVTEELERHGSILFAGAREAIEELARHCPLAIASGALRSEIERTLARERLAAHFTVIVSGDDDVASKPAPDPYLRAVERLAIAHHSSKSLIPSDCVGRRRLSVGTRVCQDCWPHHGRGRAHVSARIVDGGRRRHRHDRRSHVGIAVQPERRIGSRQNLKKSAF
jgi:hypothetical protein